MMGSWGNLVSSGMGDVLVSAKEGGKKKFFVLKIFFFIKKKQLRRINVSEVAHETLVHTTNEITKHHTGRGWLTAIKSHYGH